MWRILLLKRADIPLVFDEDKSSCSNSLSTAPTLHTNLYGVKSTL